MKAPRKKAKKRTPKPATAKLPVTRPAETTAQPSATNWPMLAAFAIVVAGVIGGVAFIATRPAAEPPAIVVDETFRLTVPTPSAELQTKVAGLRAKIAGAENAQDIGNFFFHLAAVADDPAIKNNLQLKKVNASVTELIALAGGDLFAPIQSDLDALFQPLYDRNRVLTDADRQLWRDLCHAIAWAACNASLINHSVGFDRAVESHPGNMQFVCGPQGCILQPISEHSEFAKTPLFPDEPGELRDAPQYDCEKKNADREASDSPRGALIPGERGFYETIVLKHDAKKLVARLNSGCFAEQRFAIQRAALRPAQSKPAAKVPILGDAEPDWLTHGLLFDEAEHLHFLQDTPLFAAFPHESGKGKVRLLYRAARHFDATLFSDENQTTGDCVSHGTRNACSTARAFAMLVNGEPHEWVARDATEPIYGCRGHAGQGMSVERGCSFVSRNAGVALRRKYGKHDFTTYNSVTGTNWGTSGVPRELVDELRKTPILHAALVTNLEEARDAIYNGLPLVVGSNVSFSKHRDVNGFAQRTPQGWGHCMAWLAVDDTIDPAGPCFLVCNSWGAWNDGPKGKYDIPDGSFWIRPDVARYMIGQRQTIAVGDFSGFQAQPITDLSFDFVTTRVTTGPRFDPRFVGVIPLAVAMARHGLIDPTLPENVIDQADDSGPVPSVCPKCGGDGWIGDYPNGFKCICQAAAEFDEAIEKLTPPKPPLPDPEPIAITPDEPKPDDRNPAAFAWLNESDILATVKTRGYVFILATTSHCRPCLQLKHSIEARRDRDLPIAVIDGSAAIFTTGLMRNAKPREFPQLYKLKLEADGTHRYIRWGGNDLAEFLQK